MFNNLLLSINKDHRSLHSSIPFEIFWRYGYIIKEQVGTSKTEHNKAKTNIRLLWLYINNEPILHYCLYEDHNAKKALN